MTEYHCKYDELADPNTLVDHPRNHNKHPRRQMDALCAFIEHSGWRHPVVVSKLSGRIVAGHARKAAAIHRGDKCPVVYQDFTSETEERTFLAADNKLAELADMDVEQLNVEVLELQELDVPMLEFGFEVDQKKPDPPGKIETIKSKPYNEMLISITTTFEVWDGQLKYILKQIENINNVKIVYGGKN